jgi:hypothetical protein
MSTNTVFHIPSASALSASLFSALLVGGVGGLTPMRRASRTDAEEIHAMMRRRVERSEGRDTIPGARIDETAPPNGFATALQGEDVKEAARERAYEATDMIMVTVVREERPNQVSLWRGNPEVSSRYF